MDSRLGFSKAQEDRAKGDNDDWSVPDRETIPVRTQEQRWSYRGISRDSDCRCLQSTLDIGEFDDDGLPSDGDQGKERRIELRGT